MMVEFRVFLLFLGAALLGAITPGPGMFYVAARTFAGGRPHGLASAWVPVLGLCACYCRGGRDLCARHGECGSLHSAQARRSRLSDLAWVKTWTEAKIVDPIGVESRGRTGILGRHYCRGAEPEDGCNSLAFTPHLLTQPPMSPGSSSSLGRFQLCSTQPSM